MSPTASLRILCAATRTIWALDLCVRSGAQSHQQQRLLYYRSDLNAARVSSLKSCGCSQAANVLARPNVGMAPRQEAGGERSTLSGGDTEDAQERIAAALVWFRCSR